MTFLEIWIAEVNLPDSETDAWRGFIHADEWKIAASLRREKDQIQYLASHALTRLAIVTKMGWSPALTVIAHDPSGKPRCEGPDQSSPLNISLTRTIGSVACALSVDRPIGIDLEVIQPMPDLPSVVQHALTREELAEWSDLPAEQQLQSFYEHWTRKEAIGKAEGSGLTSGPESIRVPGIPSNTTQWSRVRFSTERKALDGSSLKDRHWALADFEAEPSWSRGLSGLLAGAVAVEIEIDGDADGRHANGLTAGSVTRRDLPIPANHWPGLALRRFELTFESAAAV